MFVFLPIKSLSLVDKPNATSTLVGIFSVSLSISQSFQSFSVKGLYIVTWIVFPFSFSFLFGCNILPVVVGPISIEGPSHLPRMNLSLGKLTTELWYIHCSYHSSWKNWDILAVRPVILVSGTWPFKTQISNTVMALIKYWSPIQSSQSLFGHQLQVIFSLFLSLFHYCIHEQTVYFRSF